MGKKIKYYRIASANDKGIATGSEVSLLQHSGIKVKILRKATKAEYKKQLQEDD